MEQSTALGNLSAAEHVAISHPLHTLVKEGFRRYPKQKEFKFGSRVNLITGPNGHGKTSLLETIEYLYCGATYRNGVLREQAHISASLLNSSKTLNTTSKGNNSKRLKARNLGWYGKNDVRGSTLEKSFARFNFMDTDAAIRVSMEGTAEQISEDIANIVLGAEAGKAADRLLRIQNELKKKHKLYEKETYYLKDKMNQLGAQNKSLSTLTKQSDILFDQLNQHLQSINWTSRLEACDDTSIQVLIDNLAKANHQLKFLEDCKLEGLEKQVQDLYSYKLSMSALSEVALSLNTEMQTLISKRRTVSDKRTNIEELQTYSSTDLLALYHQQKELTVHINNLKVNLPDLKRVDMINGELAKRPVNAVLQEIRRELHFIELSKESLLIRIQEHEQSQSELLTLRDQFVASATKILAASTDKDHCPLCHTKFKEGELINRIAIDTIKDSASRYAVLKKHLVSIETKEEDLKQKESLLNSLFLYCIDTNALSTVALALDKINNDKKDLSKSQELLEWVLSKIESYNKIGLTVERLMELMEYCGVNECKIDELNLILNQLNAESLLLLEQVSTKEVELNDVSQNISTLVEKLGLSNSLPVGALVKEIETKIKHSERKISAVYELANFIDLEKRFEAISLGHHINEARDLTSKLITSIKQEQETDKQCIQLEFQAKVTQKDLTKTKTSLKYLSNAINIVSHLLTGDSSLKSIKLELIESNATIISDIFSKIHFPNEYEINVQGEEIKLIHKITQESRSLKEVSTGQRAAFALSLFLAMNKTLNNGPKVLLLDDPISHIDDVNMLSFLDYLREVAIDGDRQIFFATPNAKLASLFRHKFKFLGDNDFKEINLTR